MKKCYTIPRKGKAKKETASADRTKHSDGNWSESDDEPLCLLERPKVIPTSQSNCRGPESTVINDGARDDADSSNVPDQDRGRRSVDGTDISGHPLRNQCESQSAAPHTDEVQEVVAQRTDSVGDVERDDKQGRPHPYFHRPLPGRRI
jgi:hypothetical protein